MAQPRQLTPDQVLCYLKAELADVELYARYSRIWSADEIPRYEASLHSDDGDDDAHNRYQDRRDLSSFFHTTAAEIRRHVMVVYLFSMLETRLNQLCEAVAPPGAASPGGDRGLSLEEVCKYLASSVTPVPPDSQSWKYILEAKNTRNLLAHRLGFLKDTNRHDAQAKAAAQRDGTGTVARLAHNQLILNDVFLEKMIDSIRDLCNSMLINCRNP